MWRLPSVALTALPVNNLLKRGRSVQKIPTMLVVAAALADPEGRVLLQARPEGKAMAGLWEFPGGKVEPGEVPEHALARELREELGLEVDPSAFKPTAFASAPLFGKHMILLLYVARAWQGEPAALEGQGLAWVKPADMGALAMPPADVPLVEALQALL